MTDPTTQKIHQWILRQFPAAAEQRIGVDDSLLDSGIVDSMGTLEIVEYLEDELHIEVSDEDMVADHFESVCAIAAYAKKQLADTAGSEAASGFGSRDDDAAAI